ncbi:MAG: excinuclease ABC subunit UvrC [Candidatus Peregrinibacteria bacterium]|nr:excinuclease ABC subunit UvrC [Candidatus Peregrinibacteria bacterium]MCB9808141.1 excinuclease ABC subunit UvrC [Candidatus Peribacteria bacterium]
MENLRKRVQKAPEKPGIYRWLNKDGDVLYIGKAKNLRNRLKSYVQKEPDKSLGPWKLSLIKHIADLDVTVTDTELEALILETNLIKELKPKYNVLMKDDKNYVYVRISDDEYPELTVVRQMSDDKAVYFGPYLSAYNIKRTLDTLHEIFNFRACKKSIECNNKNPKTLTPCLQYQIGQCNGLCVGDISKKQYQERIEEVMRFLKGDRKPAMHALKDLMDSAAAQKKFERAAKLRDTLLYIQSLEEKQVVSDTSRENTDAIGIALQSGKVQVVVLRERGGKLIDERSIEIAGEKDLVTAVLCEFIPQYYSMQTDIPDLILIQEPIEDTGVLQEWLREMKGKRVEIRAPERGKKSKLLSLAESNATQKIAQQFAKWEAAAANIETALSDLREVLDLPDIPKRIEGYDISHLGGTETVGSMVVMKNGKPANKEYRSFTLRTVKEGEIDDYKAMKEVLRRRLKYLTKNDDTFELCTLKKKEREQWSNDKKTRLAIPKNWREEVIEVRKDTVCVATLDLRKSTNDKRLYGTLMIQDVNATHPILDKLEDILGKLEWYLQIPSNADKDMLALHGLVPSAKELPKDFSAGSTPVFHRRKTAEDASLRSTPDLLVIDGGKGQLSAVVEVLNNLKLQIPVIGLAKREEEVFLPGESFPVDLPNNSQASFLLQRLRDEAHRFSNAHREKRLAKGMIASVLDAVPGIGLKTKTQLLNKFQTVDNIKHASDAELLTVINAGQLSALRRSL